MKNTQFKIILMTFVLSLGASVHAEQLPRSLITDQRIRVVNYQKNNVVTLHGTTFTNTQLVFGKDEEVIDVQNGDAAAWTLHLSPYYKNTIDIKPTVLDSKTNLSVITLNASGARKNYYFSLDSHSMTENDPKKVTYAVHFVYPEEEIAKRQRVINFQKRQRAAIFNAARHPADYHWDYTFNGDKTIMPEHVFDDGQFTYLKLRPNQGIPAIFSVNNPEGRESVVNYRRVDDTIVILQSAPQFTLRSGKSHVASIFNRQMISHIQKNSE